MHNQESFFESIRRGRLDEVLECLRQDNSLALKPALDGTTPMETAAYYGQYDIVELIKFMQ